MRGRKPKEFKRVMVSADQRMVDFIKRTNEKFSNGETDLEFLALTQAHYKLFKLFVSTLKEKSSAKEQTTPAKDQD